MEANVCYNTGHCRIFQCSECGYGFNDIYLEDEDHYSSYPLFCPWCGKVVAESVKYGKE